MDCEWAGISDAHRAIRPKPVNPSAAQSHRSPKPLIPSHHHLRLWHSFTFNPALCLSFYTSFIHDFPFLLLSGSCCKERGWFKFIDTGMSFTATSSSLRVCYILHFQTQPKMCSFATGLYRSFCRSQPFLQVIYVPCNNYLDKSSKFKCHILLLRGFSTDLWPLSIRQTKFKGLQDIPEALLALPLYYFLFLCLPVHKSTFMHTCTLPCKLTLVYWHVTLCDGNHSRSTASQRLELLRNKKEHNAPKLDKAQCSFCCYSETRPSLSPTHICKIINRCLKSFLRPAYHKHSLPHYIIPFSQSPCLAPFLCISSIPSQLLTCWCTQASNTCKYSQRKTLSLPTHTHTHMLTSVLRRIPFQQNHDHQKHILLSCFAYFA